MIEDGEFVVELKPIFESLVLKCPNNPIECINKITYDELYNRKKEGEPNHMLECIFMNVKCSKCDEIFPIRKKELHKSECGNGNLRRFKDIKNTEP